MDQDFGLAEMQQLPDNIQTLPQIFHVQLLPLCKNSHKIQKTMSFIGYVAYDKVSGQLLFVNQQPQDMENQEDFSLDVQYVDLVDVQGPREIHVYSYGNQYPLCVHFSEPRDL